MSDYIPPALLQQAAYYHIALLSRLRLEAQDYLRLADDSAKAGKTQDDKWYRDRFSEMLIAIDCVETLDPQYFIRSAGLRQKEGVSKS
jgi:hypothetical protein